jgi:hypothetical protein
MVYQRVKLGMFRENLPDRLCHLFYFTLSFRMGFIADKNIKAVTNELVRLERKLTDVFLVKAHHIPNPVSTDYSGPGFIGISSAQPEGHQCLQSLCIVLSRTAYGP